MPPLKASVIIPTKNPGMLFRTVLHAVLTQKADFAFDVLVIDSGSVDGTPEYVRQINDARVRLHCIDPASFGHGRTRNLGVSMTHGEYAVLITHDAQPKTDRWLTELVACADADPSIAGVFGRHEAYPDADPFTTQELKVHFAGFDAFPVMHLDDPNRYANEEGYRQILHFFSDNNALIRRSVWETLPYPDVDFAEDQIWAKRMIEAGYKKGYAREAVVFHSHTYGLFERLQRSFDEAYAFRRLFGYVLCRGPRALLRSWLGLTCRDVAFARAQRLWRTHPSTVLRMPLDHLLRLLGHYLGARANRLPESLRQRLSRDQRLMRGVHRASVEEAIKS
jgi:rhamnosyltransferase